MSTELDIYKKYSDGTFKALRGGNVSNPPGGLTLVPAISGDDFHYSFGTRVFPTYSTDTYGKLVSTAEGKKWLSDYGVGFITHKVTPVVGDDIMAWAKSLYDDFGIRTHGITVGEPFETYTNNQWNTMISKINSMGNAVTMVNGQNEVNNARTGTLPSNWDAIAAAHQKELWTRIQALNATRATQGLNPIVVGNANLHSGSITQHNLDAAKFLPQIVGYCDTINFHLYPRGGHPTWNLDAFGDLYKSYLGNLPIVCTEAGYFTPSSSYTGGALPAPNTEWGQDIYLRKMWLEYVLRGWKVSQYEFLNDVDSTGVAREANFGVIRTPSLTPTTWSAKPSYTNIGLWNGITGGSSGTVPVNIDISQSGVKQLVVKHGAGAKLFLWRQDDVETWNYQTSTITKNTLNPATIAVTIQSETYYPNPTTVYVGADVLALDL